MVDIASLNRKIAAQAEKDPNFTLIKMVELIIQADPKNAANTLTRVMRSDPFGPGGKFKFNNGRVTTSSEYAERNKPTVDRSDGEKKKIKIAALKKFREQLTNAGLPDIEKKIAIKYPKDVNSQVVQLSVNFTDYVSDQDLKALPGVKSVRAKFGTRYTPVVYDFVITFDYSV